MSITSSVSVSTSHRCPSHRCPSYCWWIRIRCWLWTCHRPHRCWTPNPLDVAGQVYPAAEPYIHDATGEGSPAAEEYVHDASGEAAPAAEPYIHDATGEVYPAAEPYVHIEPIAAIP